MRGLRKTYKLARELEMSIQVPCELAVLATFETVCESLKAQGATRLSVDKTHRPGERNYLIAYLYVLENGQEVRYAVATANERELSMAEQTRLMLTRLAAPELVAELQHARPEFE